jgi:hypothetical protein
MAYRLVENCSATRYRANAPKAPNWSAYRRLNEEIMGSTAVGGTAD